MKKIIALVLLRCMALSFKGCQFNYEKPSEMLEKFEGWAENLGQSQITEDGDLIGERILSEDAYAGRYCADGEDETGKDVVFGGASIEKRQLKVYGTITTESGKATVRIRQNWDVTEVETDEDGNFETNLSLDNGGNYIMVNYEDFTGNIELYSEYEYGSWQTISSQSSKERSDGIMRTILKGIGKLFCALVSVLLVAVLVVGGWFGIQGYNMYQDAIEDMPISEKVETIRAMDNFVEYEELPKIYIDAVISVEDKRFEEHHGVDYLAICRAAWNDIRIFSLAEGGSTITQQLMKNEYFTQEKKLERKFAEIFAAWEIEKQYSKEDIFELYVNTIYFGSGYYGIYDAAEGYFGKEPSELNEYEAVMLAGLPNAPSAYSPDTSPELAKQQMSQVLTRMVECEVIDQDEADSLLTQANE